jgi:hypothetical protein
VTVSRARIELGASEALPYRYDLKLTLYSESENGKALDLPLELHGINVRDGRFVAAVDFAGVPAVVAQGLDENCGCPDFPA